MDNEPETPLGGCLLRMCWILVGPALLFLGAIIIGLYQIAFPSILDLIYGVLLILTVVARFLDKPLPNALPAERDAVKRYVTIFPIVAIALWLIGHFVFKMLF